jgi:hypothetical protein
MKKEQETMVVMMVRTAVRHHQLQQMKAEKEKQNHHQLQQMKVEEKEDEDEQR